MAKRRVSRSYLKKFSTKRLSKASMATSETLPEENMREAKTRTVSISDNAETRSFERRKNSEEHVKLPPLNGNLIRIKTGRKSASHQNLSTGIVMEPEFVEAQRDLTRSRASFIQTGKSYITEEDESEDDHDEKNKSKVSKFLPQIHVNIVPKTKGRRLRNSEVSDMVLTQYEHLRGLPATEHASKCMSVANNFKQKPWLHQVRQAMAIAAQSVNKRLSHHNNIVNPIKAKPSRLPPMHEENVG